MSISWRRVGAPLTLSEAGVAPTNPASLDKYADPAGEAGGSFVQIHRDEPERFSRHARNRCRSDGWTNPVI